MKNLVGIFLLVGGFALGCGHDDHNHENEHSAAEEACEHMGDPAVSTVAGATEAEATDTEESTWLHRRHDVTLTADGEQFIGYVTLEVGNAGDHQLFADVPVEVTIGGIAPEASSQVDECAEVEGGYVYDLPIGEHVMFIRADQETVAFVLEFPGSHEEHDDHNH